MYASVVLLPLLAVQTLAGCIFAREDDTLASSPHGEVPLRRRHEPFVQRDVSRALIGDLRTNITTPVGQSVANIILGKESGQNSTVGTYPTTKKAQRADPCTVWYNISADLTHTFQLNAGCGDLARQAIRAGFHDAATWSQPRQDAGKNCCGADGSLILSNTELNRTENEGLEDMPGLLLPLYNKYNVSMADLIQYAGLHATVTCTQGPRVRAFVGRADHAGAAPAGMLPEPTDSVDYLLSLFANLTIIPDDLVALVGAHTTAKQFFQDPANAGEPLDQSPGVWDFFYYTYMQPAYPPAGTYRLPSDRAIATDNRTTARWGTFANGPQAVWNEAYATAYVRLSLLGVNRINKMHECTQTLPRESTD